MPRWTEILEDARQGGAEAPTYRQMDIWTRQGLLKAEQRGDNHGRYRWWSDSERDAALLVARLIAVGFSVDLAFQVARTQPDKFGARTLILDGGVKPYITVSVDGAW